MPRRNSSKAAQSVIEEKVQTVTLSRVGFQNLHSAARALFRQAIQTDNHSPDTLLFLQALDQAIEEGHQVLGTQRSYADQYIHAVTGLTQIQMENARRILEKEGLLPNVSE